jgi:hypothetical protein
MNPCVCQLQQVFVIAGVVHCTAELKTEREQRCWTCAQRFSCCCCQQHYKLHSRGLYAYTQACSSTSVAGGTTYACSSQCLPFDRSNKLLQCAFHVSGVYSTNEAAPRTCQSSTGPALTSLFAGSMTGWLALYNP